MVESEIYNRLVGSPVNTLVGGTSGGFSSGFSSGFSGSTPGRIYPTRADEDTALPCVIYTTTGQTPVMTMSGYSGLTMYTATIDAFAVDSDEANEIASEIVSAFRGYRDGDILYTTVTNAAQTPLELGYGYTVEISLTKRE